MTTLEKDFVPYQESLELKKLGVDEPCFGYYEPNGNFDYVESHIIKDFPYLAKNSEWQDLVSAPTYSQAFRWFREKYNICGWVQESYFRGLKFHQYHISRVEPLNIISDLSDCSYEEAELACLRKLIEIVKNK